MGHGFSDTYICSEEMYIQSAANIVVTPDHVEFGSVKSEPFSPEDKAALADLRRMMENC